MDHRHLAADLVLLQDMTAPQIIDQVKRKTGETMTIWQIKKLRKKLGVSKYRSPNKRSINPTNGDHNA